MTNHGSIGIYKVMKQEENIYYHTFPSGLRMVYRKVASPVAYIGIMVGAGTRDELADEQGMAHFVEHCVFKGTEHRSSRQIINRIEAIGGEMNAYTTKEETTYYAAAPVAYSSRVLELLADMLFCPIFPKDEIHKERQVIYDEIESYNDSPSELIYDDFEAIVFDGHSLANPILGTKKSLRYFTADKAKRFMNRTYRPDRMVVFAESNRPFDKFVAETDKYVEKLAISRREVAVLSIERASPIILPDAAEPRCFRKHTHQAHVMLGGRAYPIAHERYLGLYLLNNIIGGGAMNSLLNMQLREQKGLVYTVESIYTPLSDTGYWSVYFACDPADKEQCLSLVNRQLDQLMEKPFSEAFLRRAKRQLYGQLAISAENRENNALSMAKMMLYCNKVALWKETMAIIDNLKSPELQKVAAEVFAPANRYCLQYC